jgi:hypothetical protein
VRPATISGGKFWLRSDSQTEGRVTFSQVRLVGVSR